MHTKLTLRLDDVLVRHAKSFAKKTGKSVSRIVSDYFMLLKRPARARRDDASLTPLVRSLKGILRGSALSEADDRRYLQKKYR